LLVRSKAADPRKFEVEPLFPLAKKDAPLFTLPSMGALLLRREKMKHSKHTRAPKLMAWLMMVAVLAMPYAAMAQTRLKLHSNRYSVQDDIQVGRQVAQQVEQQMPVLRDSDVTYYVENVGRRLAAAIPQEFQHPGFQYYFRVVNASDINAFALPGGPMYVNRGMI
jgi:predicted Zn-dependent protease